MERLFIFLLLDIIRDSFSAGQENVKLPGKVKLKK